MAPVTGATAMIMTGITTAIMSAIMTRTTTAIMTTIMTRATAIMTMTTIMTTAITIMITTTIMITIMTNITITITTRGSANCYALRKREARPRQRAVLIAVCVMLVGGGRKPRWSPWP